MKKILFCLLAAMTLLVVSCSQGEQTGDSQEKAPQTTLKGSDLTGQIKPTGDMTQDARRLIRLVFPIEQQKDLGEDIDSAEYAQMEKVKSDMAKYYEDLGKSKEFNNALEDAKEEQIALMYESSK